ncbi:PIG-L deacetylase family protein [Novosphingopyxis sp.]|uniref:PIG-L deacetylase family protein n=1 Tax=Novosphingopyxis sp. TaxID=2709690 RepID=UPI003B5AF13D
MNFSALRKMLVIAPHPDDEVFGCGGTIALLHATGCDVHVVVLTDGSASHRNSRKYPKSRLVAIRQAESRRALAVLGLNASKVTFLNLTDGASDQWGRDRAALRPLVRMLRHPWGAIFGPAIIDDHPDHRAAAHAVLRNRRSVPYFAYTIWPTGRYDTGGLISVPLKSVHKRKRMAAKHYRSQLGMIKDDPDGFSLKPEDLRRLARPAETFRRQ